MWRGAGGASAVAGYSPCWRNDGAASAQWGPATRAQRRRAEEPRRSRPGPKCCAHDKAGGARPAFLSVCALRPSPGSGACGPRCWAGVAPGDPPHRVVHLDRAPAVFDLEAGRRAGVERDHLVVGVAAERGSDRRARRLGPLERKADRVQGRDLQHEVVQAPPHRDGDQRQRVVAPIAVEELHLETGARRPHPDDVGEPEAEQVLVEAATGRR